MRFRSADQLMTALLSLQFQASRRQQGLVRDKWAKVIGLVGLAVGLGVVALLF